MAYATVTELTDFMDPEPAPANAARLLDRASRDIDRALKCSVYDVDTAGLPTDQAVADALREATLEQVAWRLAQGDDEGLGVAGMYSSVSIGSVTLSRGSGSGGRSGGSASEDLSEQAEQILDGAGLLGFEPWTW